MNGFDCLHLLDHPGFAILELRRNGILQSTHNCERLLWLKVAKDSATVSKLYFHSSDSSEQVHERFFEEGFLKFNDFSGTYIEKFNSAQYPLYRKDRTQLPEYLLAPIEAYLSQL